MSDGSLGYTCQLPGWVSEIVDFEMPYQTPEDKMTLVDTLARHNVEKQTGGPFGAAVFDMTTNRLLGPGVNRVVPVSNPTAHAEIVAISVAGSRLGRYDLGDQGREPAVLVTSVEPCAMCLGATPWSGVSQLIIGARDEDARVVGFDEGDKPVNWIESLESRGIAVLRDVLRTDAVEILVMYSKAGREIYNSAQRANGNND